MGQASHTVVLIERARRNGAGFDVLAYVIGRTRERRTISLGLALGIKTAIMGPTAERQAAM